MLQFGARNVVVESHHDGQTLSQRWAKWLNPAAYCCHKEISKKSIDPKTGKPKRKSALSFDIVVTGSEKR